MTRKHHRRNSQKSFPWPILVFAGILLIAAAFLLARKSGGSSSASGGTPQIAVDPAKIDYGYVPFGNNKTFKFTVTNKGTGELRFSKAPYVEVLEGCWPPDLTIGSMVLQPGESTTVESSIFMMHPGMDGKHDYGIHLMTNDPSTPDLIVHVLSDWGP